MDATAAGIEADDLLQLLGALSSAADTVVDAVLVALGSAASADAGSVDTLVGRGRGLLSHGLGRLTLHRLGRRAGVTSEDDTRQIAARLSGISGADQPEPS